MKVPFEYKIDAVGRAIDYWKSGWPSKMLSLWDPECPMHGPDNCLTTEGCLHHIELFHDVDRIRPGYTAPAIQHVERALAFTKTLVAGDSFLVHCYAGISRSTAMMLLVLIQHGETIEEAMADVKRIRPIAYPNSRIVEIGDRLLGLDHTLVEFMIGWYAAEDARQKAALIR